MGQKPPHAVAIQNLFDVLFLIFGVGFIRCQLSLDVSDADRERNEPEPDIVVTERSKTHYLDHHPRGEECLLVAEVSDTTLQIGLDA